MSKCKSCLVPARGRCRGEELGNRKCGDWRYVAYFLRLFRGTHKDHSFDLLRNARDCPHRKPIPEAEREGCGCSHMCTAEPTRSPLPNRGINVLQCWECDLAPRHARTP